MSGYEEQLHTRAEMLEESSELAAAVTEILDGASGAGLDPRAIVSLRAAVTALDPAGGQPGYQAGDRTTGSPAAGTGRTPSSSRRSVTPKTRPSTRSATWPAAGTGHRRARCGT